MEVLCLILVLVYTSLCPSGFAIIHIDGEERAGSFTLSLMAVSALWLFLMMPWVDLQCMSEVFPGHTHLLF